MSFLEDESCGGGKVCLRISKLSATYARSSSGVSETFGDGKVSLGMITRSAMSRTCSGVEKTFVDGKVSLGTITHFAMSAGFSSDEVCFYDS